MSRLGGAQRDQRRHGKNRVVTLAGYIHYIFENPDQFQRQDQRHKKYQPGMRRDVDPFRPGDGFEFFDQPVIEREYRDPEIEIG